MEEKNGLHAQTASIEPAEREAAARHQLWCGVRLILLYNSLLALWLLLAPAEHPFTALVAGLAQCLGPLLTLSWCFRNPPGQAECGSESPSSSRGPRTWTPLLFGGGIVGYVIGQAVGLGHMPSLHASPAFFPGNDAGYLGSYLFLLIGMVLLPSRPMPPATRARVFLDSLMTMTAMVIFTWYFLLGPALIRGAEGHFGFFLSAFYPLCDLILFFGLLLFLMRSGETTSRRLTHVLSLGVGLILFAHTLFGYEMLHGSGGAGRVATLGWSVGYMLIGLAALAVRLGASSPTEPKQSAAPPTQPETEALSRPPVFWHTLTPYVFLPLVGALLVYIWHAHGDARLHPGVYTQAVLLVGVLLLRQCLAILENGWLYRCLQSAYHDLQAQKHQALEYAQSQERLNAELREMHLEMEAGNRALAETNAQLEALAATDGMTGLANHRAFQERLRAEIARAQRQGYPLTLLLMDIDYFKHYNDTHGHLAGDDVVQTVARLLREAVREGDFVARYGGEEFAALLPQTDSDSGRRVAERIRATVAFHPFPHREITLSIGIAEWSSPEEGPHILIAHADRALYAAKRAGRNRLAFAGDLAADMTASDSPADEAPPLVAYPLREGWGNLEGLLQEPAGQVLTGLMAALDLRDAETEGHSQRVVRFALRLAQEMSRLGLTRFDPGELRELAFGGLLHDIGKIGVSDAILLKPGPLSVEEEAEMRRHPGLGASLLANFPLLAPALAVVRHHHERWDGTGYPDGLSGEAIPLTARIFALADTFDAMSSDRPYRAALSYPAIRAEIARLTGKQFDPNAVRAFLNIPEADWDQLRRKDSAELALHPPKPTMQEAA